MIKKSDIFWRIWCAIFESSAFIRLSLQTKHSFIIYPSDDVTIKFLLLVASLFSSGVRWRVTATMATQRRKMTVATPPMTKLARFNFKSSSLEKVENPCYRTVYISWNTYYVTSVFFVVNVEKPCFEKCWKGCFLLRKLKFQTA